MRLQPGQDQNQVRMLNGDNSEMEPVVASTPCSDIPNTDVEPTLLNWELFELQLLSFPATPIEGSFKLNYASTDSAALNYNCSASDVQTALRAITGLEAVVVTGSVAAGFEIRFNDVEGDVAALTVTNNSLKSAGTIEVQNVAFSDSPPDEGSLTLRFAGADAVVAFDAADPKATLQSQLRLISGLESVTVLGSFVAGFDITFTGYDGDAAMLTEQANTLKKSNVAITTTISETTKGVAKPAVTPAISESVKGAT